LLTLLLSDSPTDCLSSNRSAGGSIYGRAASVARDNCWMVSDVRSALHACSPGNDVNTLTPMLPK